LGSAYPVRISPAQEIEGELVRPILSDRCLSARSGVIFYTSGEVTSQ